MEEVWFRRTRCIAAGSSRTVLALRNKHRTVPRALPLWHSCVTIVSVDEKTCSNTWFGGARYSHVHSISRSQRKFFQRRKSRQNTYRFRPQTAQVQLCFCCSFIFLRTVSFSILTRSRRSFSLRPSQNSLMRSRSSVVLVLQILLFGLTFAEAAAWGPGGRCFCGADALEEGGDG